ARRLGPASGGYLARLPPRPAVRCAPRSVCRGPCARAYALRTELDLALPPGPRRRQGRIEVAEIRVPSAAPPGSMPPPWVGLHPTSLAVDATGKPDTRVIPGRAKAETTSSTALPGSRPPPRTPDSASNARFGSTRHPPPSRRTAMCRG